MNDAVHPDWGDVWPNPQDLAARSGASDSMSLGGGTGATKRFASKILRKPSFCGLAA